MTKLWKLIRRLRLLLFTQIAKIFIKDIGQSARIGRLTNISGGENIHIRANSLVWDYTWLGAVSPDNTGVTLIIGEKTTIGRFNHIYATKRVEFGKNVLTADKVYIADNSHDYEDINVPVKKQSIKQLNEVYIGDGAWIGENVCIIGASIGKNCVIGANSVVLNNIPDYSVAAGVPAKIIKQYDFDSKSWVKCKTV